MSARAEDKMIDDRIKAETLLETDADFQAFVADGRWNHFACMAQRPGLDDCLTDLEERHYTPGTERNDLYHLRVVKWQGLHWILVSIPSGDKLLMERTATAHGLRVADGVPTLISSDGMERFPASGRNVYSLENLASHPVYRSKHEAAQR